MADESYAEDFDDGEEYTGEGFEDEDASAKESFEDGTKDSMLDDPQESRSLAVNSSAEPQPEESTASAPVLDEPSGSPDESTAASDADASKHHANSSEAHVGAQDSTVEGVCEASTGSASQTHMISAESEDNDCSELQQEAEFSEPIIALHADVAPALHADNAHGSSTSSLRRQVSFDVAGGGDHGGPMRSRRKIKAQAAAEADEVAEASEAAEALAATETAAVGRPAVSEQKPEQRPERQSEQQLERKPATTRQRGKLPSPPQMPWKRERKAGKGNERTERGLLVIDDFAGSRSAPSLGPLSREDALRELRKLRGPARGRWLFPLPQPKPKKVYPETASHAHDWDDRHHLSGTENELLPKRLRVYFSAPKELPALAEHLKKMPNAKKNLRKLEAEEVPPTKPVFISADGGAPVCPERHTFGGEMSDRDGEQRAWNDRWNNGMQQLNEGLHPLHRQYFTQKSLFEAAPSQRWRRYLDSQVAHGVWKPLETTRPALFPPLGV